MSAESEKKSGRGRRAARKAAEGESPSESPSVSPESADELRPPYLGAAIAGVAVFALYAITRE